MTMVLVFVIAALVIGLGQSMRVDLAVAANEASSREAAVIERGAEQYVLAALAQTSTQPVETLGNTYFERVPLGRGYFWIVRPNYNDPSLPGFGLVDESSKRDLNSTDHERLLRMPGMTSELAAAIVDWRDEDSEVTQSAGAESDTYLGRTPGYNAKNANFETVEELLLVQGMTPALLHGEPASTTSTPLQNDLYRTIGLFPFLTVWGAEAASVSGERIDINDNDSADDLRDLLRETFGDSRGNELAGRLPEDDVEDVFDWARQMDLTSEELAQILDRITVGNTQPVKLNVNQAPREALLTLEGLSESDVDTLIRERRMRVIEDPYSYAWVTDVLEQKAVGLGQQITGRGRYYSADIVAVAGDGRAYKRVRIVVDTEAATPTIVYRRDLTDQGWPLDVSILNALRAGEAIVGPTGSF